MILFLYGQETYRMRQKLREILAGYQRTHAHPWNIRHIDCEDMQGEPAATLESHVLRRQGSMFSGKNLFVLANPFKDKELKELLLQHAELLAKADEIVVLTQEGAIPRQDALLKALQKHATCQEFSELTPAQMRTWQQQECEALGITMDPGARDEFCFRVGSDLWRACLELQKIAAFCHGRTIVRDDIGKLVHGRIETDIFKTLDAIALRDKKKALILLRDHVRQGASPLYLLTMIVFQIRNVLVARDLQDLSVPAYEMARRSGMHPFVAKKASAVARQFSRAELQKIYRSLFAVEKEIKMGRIDAEAALDLIVIGL